MATVAPAASSSDPNRRPLAPAGPLVLGQLRRRIRFYVIAEGILAAVAWLLGVFWIALGLDYLPVKLGADELPTVVRAVILVIAAGGLGWVLWRYVGRRAFRKLSDESLALLLERSHRDFQDSLVTSVELAKQHGHAETFHADLLRHTREEAEAKLPHVRLRTVFNAAPVGRKALLAGVLVAVTIAFGVFAPQAFGQSVARLLFLSGQPWPRSAQIEIVGLKVQGGASAATGEETDLKDAAATGDEVAPGGDRSTATLDGLPRVIPFQDRSARVARGVSVALLVRADTSAPSTPRECVLRYRTADGGSGRASLRKDGSPREGFQSYIYEGKPFRNIVGTVTFSVTGDDHRLSDYEVEVVEPPSLRRTDLACVFPDYLVDQTTSQFLPRTLRYGPGLTLPVGTSVNLVCQANKPLSQAVVTIRGRNTPPPPTPAPAVNADGTPTAPVPDPEGAVEIPPVDPAAEPTIPGLTRQVVAITGSEFTVPLGELSGDTTIDLLLTDAEGVTARESDRIVLVVRDDQPPQLDLRLAGIGTAVTPDVRIPITGRISDDHGLARAWFEATIEDRPARIIDFPPPVRDDAAAEIDFRAIRNVESDPVALRSGGRLTLQVRAADRFNLLGQPAHIGSADPWAFDVVTPEELLRRLELVEAGYRKRLEQIIEEMTQTRDELVRVKFDALSAIREQEDTARKAAAKAIADAAAEAPVDGAAPAETPTPNAPTETPGGKTPDTETPTIGPPVLEERQQTLRTLRVQQATLQSAKAAGEVNGLAEAFLALKQELENNRVDAEDRRKRLEDEVSQPLREVATSSFPEFDRRLKTLEGALTDPQLGLAESDAAVQQADAILVSLDTVLQKLVKFEGYNELLEIVRGILDDQQDLENSTREERERQALESLLE